MLRAVCKTKGAKGLARQTAGGLGGAGNGPGDIGHAQGAAVTLERRV